MSFNLSSSLRSICFSVFIYVFLFAFFSLLVRALLSSFFSLPSSPGTSVYTVNASLVLYSHGKITNPQTVTSNSFLFPHSPDSQCRGLCCIIALVLSGQWLCSLVGLWCNLQNTRASVVCSMGSEWACRVSVLTFRVHSYSQRGVC